MLKVISRKVTISKDTAEKEKFTEKLPGLGWTLFDGNWSKTVPVPQFCVKENDKTPGGVPDYKGISLDDILIGVEALHTEHGIPVEDIAGFINNGVYLAFNAKAKPKKENSQENLEKAYFQQIEAEVDATKKTAMFAAFGTAVATGGKKEFLTKHFAGK